MTDNVFDFKLGDRVDITARDGSIKSTAPYIVGSEPIEANTPNVAYYVGDEIPQLEGTHLHLDDPKNQELLGITLNKSLDEILPTVPGKYEDVSVRNHNELIAAILDEEYVPDYWTLNEDGTWTDSDGESHPASENWILAVTGAEFVPAG